MPVWPDWWEWELELTPHLLKRMLDRRFNEVELRTMMENAAGLQPSASEEGRWVVQTRRDGEAWEIVVEPMHEEKVLVVVTGYALD